MAANADLARYLPLPAGPVRADGIRAAGWIALEHWLETRPGPLLVADLGLGGWRPGQLVQELAAQLGIVLPMTRTPALPLPAEGGLDADTVGVWVDHESRGDVSVALAEQSVRALLPGLRAIATLAVIVPPRAADWRAIDRWSLIFMASLQAPLGFRLTLVDAGPVAAEAPDGVDVQWADAAAPAMAPAAAALLDPAPPEGNDWLGLVPGVIPAPLARAVGLAGKVAERLIMLPSGVGLVTPEMRARAAAAGEDAIDELKTRAAGVPWLRAFAAARSPTPDMGPLLDRAWDAFGLGATDLALDLAERAVAAAADARQTVAALLVGQTLRLVTQDYAGLAGAPPTPDGASAEDRQRLDRFRAWGRALTGDGAGALALFGDQPPSEPLDDQPWLDLYLRNIHALALVRAGEADAALAVEEDIARRLADMNPRPWHLAYLNAINLSRLHRARRDYATSKEWLERAEAATLGAALPSDIIHFHVLRARLALNMDEPALARRHWLAAALVYSALPLPGAIGWRVATAILGKPVRSVDPEAVAAAFTDHLALAPGDEEPPTFLLAEQAEPGSATGAIGAPGWGVLAAGTRQTPAFDGAQHRALRAGLAPALGIDTTASPTLIVDLRDGNGLPASLADLVGVALWHGVERVTWDGEDIDIDALLADCEQRLAVSPGVAAIDETTVRFKRYRPPLVLAEAAAAFMRRPERAIESLADEEQAIATGLIAAGVLVAGMRLGVGGRTLEAVGHG